jgi:hypothetical protein
MNKVRRSAPRWLFCKVLVVLLSWLAVSPRVTQAQTTGNNAVFGSSGPTGSAAWIDASVWYTGTTGPDLCLVIRDILTSATAFPTYPATGAVIDARGIILSSSGTQTCNDQPWAPPAPSGGWPPATILLPAANINIKVTWTLPSNTRIVGEGRTTDLLNEITSGDMIDMGSSGCTAGSNISIENLKLTGQTDQINGIVNNCAQDGSYVNHVNLYEIGLTGLTVGVNATGSGPYSDIDYSGSPGTPVCVILQAQTQGLHGFTCIGDPSVSDSNHPGHAAIYLDGSNNTVEDVHFEGFWDGIQVGDSATASGNTIFNVDGSNSSAGPVTTVVHICGPLSHTSTGQCAHTNETINDLTILQVRNDKGGTCTTTVQDDLTGTTTTLGTTAVPGTTVGMYALGDPVSGLSTAQYSRFAIDPSSVVGPQSCLVNGSHYPLTSSAVPTWGLGGAALSTSATCTTPGALYSNTAGTSTTNSIYVCSGGNWLKIFSP